MQISLHAPLVSLVFKSFKQLPLKPEIVCTALNRLAEEVTQEGESLEFSMENGVVVMEHRQNGDIHVILPHNYSSAQIMQQRISDRLNYLLARLNEQQLNFQEQ